MIRITVELLSARTGQTTKLGEMHICNESGSTHISDYSGRILRKPHFKTITRMGYVKKHDRINLTVWSLIAKMLVNMGYNK